MTSLSILFLLTLWCASCGFCQLIIVPPVFSCPVWFGPTLSLTFFFPLHYFGVATQYDPKLAPGLGKIVWSSPISGRLYYVGQTFHHNIPHAGHMRLTAVPYVTYGGRTRPSVLLAEIDRINRKMRPSLAYQPAEDFLNSRSIVNFDDEARSIRAQTAALLKRIYTPVPRVRSAMPTIQPRYIETPIPERITSDVYIERMLSPVRDVRRDINSRSYYSDAAAKSNIGKGHLACVSYAGGRAFQRRKNLYPDVDQIKNEVKFLSHYEKTREAAAVPQVDSEGMVYYAPLYTRPKRDPNKPLISRFYKGAVTAPIEPAQRISAKVIASVPVSPIRPPPAAAGDATDSVPQVQRQTSLQEQIVSDEPDDMASRLSRKKKKKQEERAAEEMEQKEMARKAEQVALEAAKEEQRKAEEARKEAERKAEEARLAEEARQAEETRLAEEARKAEEARLAEEARKAEEARLAEEARKAEEERLEAERRAEAARKEEEERIAAEKKAEEERLAAEKKAEEERLAAEKKAEEERQAEADRLAAEAEQKRQEEEELAGQQAELGQLEAEAEAVAEDATQQESAAEPSPAADPEPVAEPEAVAESEPVVESEPTVTSPQTEEPEPTVEEPASPVTEAPGPAIEEVFPDDE